MGWWSTDVLGGDPPLDAICVIEDKVGMGNLYPPASLSADERSALAKVLTEEVSSELFDEFTVDFVSIQVLGVMIMASGGEMTDRVRAGVINAAGEDEWAKEDSERRAVMDQLTEAVSGYSSGVPTDTAHQGLFEVIADHLAK
jgi:hypothetical protein